MSDIKKFDAEQSGITNIPDVIDISPEERKRLVVDFYKHHREIIALVRIYRDHPLYNKFANGKAFQEPDRFAAYFESVEKLPIDYRLPNVLIGLADYGKNTAKYADKVGLKTTFRMDLPLYTDLDTVEDYRRYVLESKDYYTEGLKTYYFYNETGEFKKIQQTVMAFDSGKEEVYQVGGHLSNNHGFKSEITPADFAIVGTSLRLAKEGFMQRIRAIDSDLATKITSESSTKSLEAP